MPVIPTFEVSGSSAIAPAREPRADPNAFMAPGEALAGGGRQLSDLGDAWTERYAAAGRAADAAKLSASVSQQLGDLRYQTDKIPNAGQAYDTFGTGSKQIIQQALGQITDPLVRASVEQRVTPEAIVHQLDTRRAAFGLEASQQSADQDGRYSQYARTLSAETNPAMRALKIEQAQADSQQMVDGGWQHAEDATKRLSAMYRSALTMRMENDPIGAQRLLGEFQDHMTAEDIATADSHLKYAVPRRQAEDSAMGVYNRYRGATGPLAPIADSTLPPEARGFLPALSAGEGNYNSPAPKGDGSDSPIPNNRYQFLRSTWNEQAPLAGVDVNDFSPAAQDRVAWSYARNVYATNTGGRDLQADLRAGGHEQQVATALNKVWPSLPGGKEQNTDANTWTARLAKSFGRDTIQPQIEQFNHDNPNMEPRFQLYGVSIIRRLNNEDSAGLAQARGDLERDLRNLSANYEQGITKDEVPVDRIRQLVPGQRGDGLIRDLTVTRAAGDLYSGVEFATPDQEQAARQALATPGALASNLIQIVNHRAVGPAGGQITASDETPDAIRLRTHLLARYDELLNKKHKALLTDPLGFTASEPGVAAKLAAIDPDKPETFTDAINTALDAQHRMGIPDRDARVLTNDQVAANVRALTTTDQAKADMGQALDRMAERYGDAWPRALHEMQTFGKLAPGWNVVASMTEPGQIGARQDLIRALQQDSERGGAKRLSEIVPTYARQSIDRDIDGYLDPFRRSASIAGATGNFDLIDGVRSSIRSLAYLYATQDMSAGAALQKATDGILNAKYDFSGTLRAPKGQMAAAEAMGADIQNHLTPAMLAPVSGNKDLTPEQRAEIVATAAKRNGVWAANERDDGAVLLAPLRDGSHVPVILKDGSRVEMKWRDLTRPSAGASMSPEDQARAMTIQ